MFRDPRIQAGSSVDEDVVATGTGTFVGTTSTAIGQVRAAHAIRGNIIAEEGDIFAVRVLNVSPLPAAQGITGDIIAKGNIGTIFSTGPIGVGNSKKIWAGGR